jgi:mono/diheme cytochrome c family protein
MIRHHHLVTGLLFTALCLNCASALADADQSAAAKTSNGSYWSAKTIADNSAPRGKVLFDRFCTECHGVARAKAGPPGSPPAMGLPGTAELQVKYKGALPALLEERTDLNFDWVRQIIRHGYYVMAPIRKTELSDAEVDLIAAYLTKDKRR